MRRALAQLLNLRSMRMRDSSVDEHGIADTWIQCCAIAPCLVILSIPMRRLPGLRRFRTPSPLALKYGTSALCDIYLPVDS
jgi:hypothetical protein